MGIIGVSGGGEREGKRERENSERGREKGEEKRTIATRSLSLSLSLSFFSSRGRCEVFCQSCPGRIDPLELSIFHSSLAHCSGLDREKRKGPPENEELHARERGDEGRLHHRSANIGFFFLSLFLAVVDDGGGRSKRRSISPSSPNSLSAGHSPVPWQRGAA